MAIGNFIILALVLVLGVFFQGAPAFHLFGVKPNLILSALLVAPFFIGLGDFLLLALFTATALAVFPGLGWSILFLPVLGLVGFWLHWFLPWHRVFNLAILIAGSTFLLYLLINRQFLFEHWLTVLTEIIYNLFIGLAIFLILRASRT